MKASHTYARLSAGMFDYLSRLIFGSCWEWKEFLLRQNKGMFAFVKEWMAKLIRVSRKCRMRSKVTERGNHRQKHKPGNL